MPHCLMTAFLKKRSKNNKKIFLFHQYYITSVTYSGRLGDRYTSLATQTQTPKKHFYLFFFQLHFDKKCVKVAINDFTIHLIVLKW